MRFELKLAINERRNGTLLPCNYQYPLSSVIYKILNEGDPEFSVWLHEKGYVTPEQKQFKLFTFSNLYIPRFRIFKDRLNILADHVYLTVSFYPVDAMEAFVVGLFNSRCFTLGDKESRVSFEIVSVEKLPDPKFSSIMCFKTLSPIFIEEKEPDTRKTNHLSPEHPMFIRLLHLNLLEKYRAFYGKEPEPSWPETQMRLLTEPKAKTITIKSGTPQETRVKGYMFQFELTGEPELLKLGYFSGFGRLGSQGFGVTLTRDD